MSEVLETTGPWRTAGKYAGVVTASYALGLTLFFIALSQSEASRGWELPVEFIWLATLFTAIPVFPCSYVLARALFAVLPPEFGRSRAWRAWLAGPIAAGLIFSPAGEKVGAILEAWRVSWFPDGGAFLVILVPLSMIQGMLMLAMAVTWSLPPWRRARLRSGGAEAGVLPGGLR